MRIVIDMQGAQTESRFRGIGRYTMDFVKAVVRNREKHEVILALNGTLADSVEPIREAFAGLLPTSNIRVWESLSDVKVCEGGNHGRREVAELIREAFLLSLRPDVIHVCSLFEGYGDDAVTSIGRFDSSIPVTATIHDLIPLLNPAHYLEPGHLFTDFYLDKLESLKRSAALLSISESSREEAMKHLGVFPENVINTSEGVNKCFRPVSLSDVYVSSLKRTLGIKNDFILYSGGADERKNLKRLIYAFARTLDGVRKSVQLVMAGKIPSGERKQLRQFALEAGLDQHQLIMAGYVSDDELIALYNTCLFFVFPSWHEGFGLPPLEAMACGAAVIGADATSIPEVIGLQEALFDPFDVDSLSSLMVKIINDENFRHFLQKHGLRQAKNFSWDKAGLRAIGMFERVAGQVKANDHRLQGDELVHSLVRSIASLQCAMQFNVDECATIASAIAANHPAADRKSILYVDVSELVQHDARTGVQRVTRSVLFELLNNPPEAYDVHPVYATTSLPGYRCAQKFTRQFLGLEINGVEDLPIDPTMGDIFFGLDLQAHVVSAQMDILKAMHRRGVQVCFLVHDLLPITMPSLFAPGTDVAHADWLKNISHFDGVVCVSKTVADELKLWLGRNRKNLKSSFFVQWSHNGADVENSVPLRLGVDPEADKVLSILRSRLTFLAVGTIEPRKGHSQILSAFEQLWREGLDVNFVIVGKQGWMTEKLAAKIESHPEIGDRLFWLKGIGDDYLERVYEVSSCLIAGSLGEGFGLPLIEAAHHQLPVIARDIPVFREVAGEHAFFFHGHFPEDLAKAIKAWMVLYQEGHHPHSEGMKWITWKESTRNLLSLILPSDVQFVEDSLTNHDVQKKSEL